MRYNLISKIKFIILLFVGILFTNCSVISAGVMHEIEAQNQRSAGSITKELPIQDNLECIRKLALKELSIAVSQGRDNFEKQHENFKDQAKILIPYGLTTLVLLGKSGQTLSPFAMLGCTGASWLLSDLGTGIVHWTFDVLDYTNKRWPEKLRSAAKIFQYHHEFPGHCVQESFWYHTRAFYLNFGVPLLATASILSAYDYNILTCLLTTSAIIAPLGDYVHAISHGKHNNRFVRFLQKTGIIISREHHRRHHKRPDHATNYCIWNGHMNIILDPIMSVSRSAYKFFRNWCGKKHQKEDS